MKSKVLLSVSMFLLILSCSIENNNEEQIEVSLFSDETLITENYTILFNQDGNFISKDEDKIILKEINSYTLQEKSQSRTQCQREIIRVYWNNEAESDFELRENIRLKFMRDHELDIALRSNPETIDNDSELWIFRDRGTHPCHTQGVEAKINNQGNDHVNTDDD